MHGGNGVDFLWGGSGADCIDGGANTDFIFGHAGNDRLLGRGGADLIWGGDGFDLIDGGAGFDSILDGGPGFDVIWLGTGGGNAFSGYIINGNSNLSCNCYVPQVRPLGQLRGLETLPSLTIRDCKPVALPVLDASLSAFASANASLQTDEQDSLIDAAFAS